MDLKETDILGPRIENHWYYRSKAKAMSQLLGDGAIANLLDVGAGSGFFSKYLLKKSIAKRAWCVDVSYDHDSDEIEHGRDIHFRKSVETSEADTVLLMDVLEHVDDDVGLLREYVEKVPKGSRFLISVPAFDFMWSGHDEFLDHKRRYSLSQLESVVTATGLTVVKGAYYFGGVFPLAFATRAVGKMVGRKDEAPKSQLRNHHPAVNEFLASISQAELAFFESNKLGGLTVFCLALKE